MSSPPSEAAALALKAAITLVSGQIVGPDDARDVAGVLAERGFTITPTPPETAQAVVERAARAHDKFRRPMGSWSSLSRERRADYIEAMRAALATLSPSPGAGWVMVPREPTEAMADAGMHTNSEWLNDGAPLGERRYRDPALSVWRVMLRTALGEDPNHGWKEAAPPAEPVGEAK